MSRSVNKGRRKSKIESESSDIDLYENNDKKEEHAFLPATFEGMMESFGVKLERKAYQDQFTTEIEQMNKMLRNKDTDKEMIEKKATKIGDMMKR